MPVSLTSPDTGNYYVGKGILSFKATGEGSFRDLGDCPECELELNIENLDHFSSRSGIRSKDLVVVLEQGGTVRFVMHEWTPENFRLWALGSEVDEVAVGGASFDIMAADSIEGEWKFVGTNAVGPNYTVHLHNVRISPTSSINLIQEDDWGGIEVTGEILLSQTTSKFGTVQLTNLGDES